MKDEPESARTGDESDQLNPAQVVKLLNCIPGALERARLASEQVRNGQSVPLDEL